MSTKPFRILITPLNWGLGHATRCFPIASAFAKTLSSKREIEIHWASDGQALALLKAELPKGTFIHELPSYGIRYPTRSASVNMVLGGPKMGAAILQEAKAVAALHDQYDYDFILSDNRFGCKVPGVPSAIMTHQVHLPIRNWFSRKLGNLLNQRFLSKFDQVIIPDVPNHPRLAGNMSAPHPKTPTHYIGPVSRFSPTSIEVAQDHIGLAIVLSGPEPQRTKLESHLLNELRRTPIDRKIVFIRGLPGIPSALSTDLLKQIEKKGIQLQVFDFMKAKELSQVLAEADVILTRPGYTTVMDLYTLRRKAIYIPTPGQPEQEWLGESIEATKLGIGLEQKSFVLVEALEKFKEVEQELAAIQSVDRSLLEVWVEDCVWRIANT